MTPIARSSARPATAVVVAAIWSVVVTSMAFAQAPAAPAGPPPTWTGIDTEPTKFAVDGGVGSITEKNPGVDVRTSAALTAGEKLQVQLTPTAVLKHATVGLWKADDLEDGLYTFSIGLATQISQRVQLSVDLLDSFKNKPPTATTKKNDVALVTAITTKF